jgi:NitT/TauT family transport system permease protein/putative hydroxymethylpyrimidine transport system permease protein
MVVAIIVSWHFLVTHNIWDSTIVPSPARTLAAAIEFRSELAKDLMVTLVEVAAGFLITVASALLSAVALRLLPSISKPAYSLLVILQCIPLWGIAPILFYWAGPGLLARLIVITLVAFFPVLVNTLEGMQDIDLELSDLFTSMDASRWQRLSLLEMPSALYMILAGAKVTLTLCVIGAVFAEMLIGDMIGLGYRIKEANAHFRIDLAIAAVILLAAMTLLIFSILTFLSGRLQPWNRRKE